MRPYVMTQRLDKAMVVPPEKVRIIPAEGDTNIVRPLRSIVKAFDQDEAAMGGDENLNRAVLIITDAAVDDFPDSEFLALSRRNIVPYIIYINTSDIRTMMMGRSSTPRLIEMIREYGGDCFDVTDRDSLARAYAAIGRARGRAGRAKASRAEGADLFPFSPCCDGHAGRGDPDGVCVGAAVGYRPLTACPRGR